MARTDGTALVTDPAAEYTARTELERLDLNPYLPQIRKCWQPTHGNTAHMRRYPLFPRYLLLPIRDADSPAIRVCRGLRKIKPVLADGEGRPWRCPAVMIDAAGQRKHLLPRRRAHCFCCP